MIEVRSYSGAAVAGHLDAVARLRIAVFRDWPYLYAGDMAYEADYLAAYARSPHSLFVLAFDGPKVVGASTAVPLIDETEAFRQSFVEHGIEPVDVFYFGESVLLPAYRGRGLGNRFFDAREAAAQEGGFALTAFCAVERAPDDPRRPAGHRDHDAFWTKRGYRRHDSLACQLAWQEVGEAAPSRHRLRFWLREWPRGVRRDGRQDEAGDPA